VREIDYPQGIGNKYRGGRVRERGNPAAVAEFGAGVQPLHFRTAGLCFSSEIPENWGWRGAVIDFRYLVALTLESSDCYTEKRGSLRRFRQRAAAALPPAHDLVRPSETSRTLFRLRWRDDCLWQEITKLGYAAREAATEPIAHDQRGKGIRFRHWK
jgi:hypothetical protein